MIGPVHRVAEPGRRTGAYAALVDILSDPTDPEQEERLEWLGLDRADDFDPARFDPAEVTKDLSVLR